MIKTVVFVIIILILTFIYYRYYITNRATKKRDKQVLDLIAPVEAKIREGHTPDLLKIQELADDPLTRGNLYMLLEQTGNAELFPQKHKNLISAAEAQLTFWLMHPNELGVRPIELELGAMVTRSQDSVDYKFVVYKFKWSISQKDKRDTWTVGVVGPFDESRDPYKQGTPFSTFMNYENQSPEKHVDWFIDKILVAK